MSTFHIHSVAAGEYPGAPTLPELREWARENDVHVRCHRNLCYARLDGFGGVHKTREGATHLLYHSIHVLSEGHVS